MSHVCFNTLQMLERRRRDLETVGYFRDDARITIVYKGGCLKVALNAGLARGTDKQFGISRNGCMSIIPLVDEIVVSSGGAIVFLAQLNGKHHEAEEILRQFTTAEFLSLMRLAKHQVLGSGEPAVNNNHTLKIMERFGTDITLPEKLGINVTYVATEHETGKPVYIRNPRGYEATKAALLATMQITGAAGDPINYEGLLVRDGSHSHDPLGTIEAINRSTHILFLGNESPANIGPDSRAMRGIAWNALSKFPEAWSAYANAHHVMDNFHTSARSRISKNEFSRGMTSAASGSTVVIDALHPPPNFMLSATEQRIDKLVAAVKAGEAIAEMVGNRHFRNSTLADYVPIICKPPAADISGLFHAATNFASHAMWAAPAAMLNLTSMGLSATTTTLEIARRSIPWMGNTTHEPTDPPTPL